MPDVVAPSVRSRMMAGIRSRNTKPEMILRKGLHQRGFRFRLHTSHLPGKPDMAFAKYQAVIFANGCFWHGHDCPLFRWPSSRQEFWRGKIDSNRIRDSKVRLVLAERGWRVLTVWECAIKGSGRMKSDKLIDRCVEWLTSGRGISEIRGA